MTITRQLFIAFAAVALSLRLLSLVPEVELDGDAGWRYDPLARNLLAGNGFSRATEPPYHPDELDQPGYPLFVASIYWLTSGSRRAVVFIQILIELVTLLLVVAIARRLNLSRHVQMTALGIGLVCPFLPVFSAILFTEVLATFAITLTCYLLLRAVQDAKTAAWLYAGVAAGFSLLVRPDLMIAVTLMVVVAVTMYWLKHSFRATRATLIFLLTLIAVLTPWMIRNHVTFGAPRPLGGVHEQVEMPYIQWLDTWLDDSKLIHPYWWHALDPTSTGEFPAGKLGHDERRRAERALQMAREQGTFRGEPERQFVELADEAKRERALMVYAFAPLKRCVMAIVRMPSYIHNSALKAVTYLFWLALLLFIAAGAWLVIKERMPIMLIPAAIIAGRFTLPLLSALGSEPRYLFEALPVGFIVGAIAVAKVWRSKNDC